MILLISVNDTVEIVVWFFLFFGSVFVKGALQYIYVRNKILKARMWDCLFFRIFADCYDGRKTLDRHKE